MNQSTSGFQFKKVRAVTLQLFKWKNGVERYFKLTSPMFLGKELAVKDGKEAQKPVTLINCIDMETGEEGQFIVGSVLESTLSEDEEYAGNKYIGKCFAITQLRDASKAYNTYTVIEIEPDETPSAPAPAEVKEKKAA